MGVGSWVPPLLYDRVTAWRAGPGSHSPFLHTPRPRVGAHGVSHERVAADRGTPAREFRECALPNGPVALAGSLSQPVRPSSLTDGASSGCSSLGLREENPKAGTGLGRPSRGRGPFLCPLGPSPDAAGCGVGAAAEQSANTGPGLCRPARWRPRPVHSSDEERGEGRRHRTSKLCARHPSPRALRGRRRPGAGPV